MESETVDRAELLLEPDASPPAAKKRIAQMPIDPSLWSYDSDKEAISEPGVFVTVRRWAGLLWLRFQNHGWSTDWAEVSERDFVRSRWVCREDNCVGKKLFHRGAGMRWTKPCPLKGSWSSDESGKIEAHDQRRIDGERTCFADDVLSKSISRSLSLWLPSFPKYPEVGRFG